MAERQPRTWWELLDDIDRAYPIGSPGHAAVKDVMQRVDRFRLRGDCSVEFPPTRLERAVANVRGCDVDDVIEARYQRRRSR